MELALPPLHEQNAIVASLIESTTQLDALTEAAASAITLLQERRAALISAAVTGKIDLRDDSHSFRTLHDHQDHCPRAAAG